MARLWEKMLWAALCGTALGWAGCKPERKAAPPPQVETPADVAPADAASSPSGDAAAGDAVDPDAEGVAEAIDGGVASDAGDAALASDVPGDAAKKPKKKKRLVEIATGYGPPPAID